MSKSSGARRAMRNNRTVSRILRRASHARRNSSRDSRSEGVPITAFYRPKQCPSTIEIVVSGAQESVECEGGGAPAAGRLSTEPVENSQLTGCLGKLPCEILEEILKHCKAKELGCLEATCSYFLKSGITEKIAQQHLQEIPRARGLEPRKEKSERWLHVYHFIVGQSAAAAQSTAISCGSKHTSALLVPKIPRKGEEQHHYIFTFGRVHSPSTDTSSSRSWIKRFNGQLGVGKYSDDHFEPKEISLGFSRLPDDATREEEIMPAVVSCGGCHVVSISRKGTLYGWGQSNGGELGLGPRTPVDVLTPRQVPMPHRRIVSVTTGDQHTLAITENGELWTCGRGRRGQLGHGSFQDHLVLTRVDALKNSHYRIVSAAAGHSHSLALASDGSLFSWGDGQYGQLGHASLEHIQLVGPLAVPIPQNVMELEPRTLTASNRVTSISAGGNHSVALTVGGQLLTFGRNHSGQLGTGDTQPRWRPTRVDVDKGLEPNENARAVQVVCGSGHTIALVLHASKMKVMSTGSNFWGQLGLDDYKNRTEFEEIPGLIKEKIVSVQSGDEHSCAVTGNGVIYIWGRGDCGQLGLGDGRSRKVPSRLPGYFLVHPDKTLRRVNRCPPKVRKIIEKHPALCRIPSCFKTFYRKRESKADDMDVDQ